MVVVIAASATVLAPKVVHQVRVMARYVAPSRAPEFDKRPDNPELVQAAHDGNLLRVTALLRRGVSPDGVERTSDTEGESALQAAAANGKLAVVQLLLDHGADINAADFWGSTALVDA
jgi:hypothetical protein